jgi:hypothetical protein
MKILISTLFCLPLCAFASKGATVVAARHVGEAYKRTGSPLYLVLFLVLVGWWVYALFFRK